MASVRIESNQNLKGQKNQGDLGTKSSLKVSSKEQIVESSSKVTENTGNSDLIEVIPPEVIFKDIQTQNVYEITVLVRNLSKKARRIRVFQPKTNKFRCDYEMEGALAAGLAMKLIVSFETNVLNDFHDVLEIVSEEKFKYKLPLHAYKPNADIIFEPFINLGFCQVSKEKVEIIEFKNEGKIEGKVELKYDNIQDIVIKPSSVVIKPDQIQNFKLIYTPRDAGIFRGIIEVNIEGQSVQQHIDISATSVSFDIFLIDEQGHQLQQVDFGNIHYGELREKEVYLVNNSPKRFNFKIKFYSGFQNELEEIQTPNELGREQTERIMTSLPSIGVIDSYSQIPVRFFCKSRIKEEHEVWVKSYVLAENEHRDNLDKDYQYSAIFEFEGAEENRIIRLRARAQCPQIKISPKPIYNFGECPVNDKLDILVNIFNKSQNCQIDYQFLRVPNYQAEPKSSVILPEQSQTFTLTFQPRSLGKFDTSIDLLLVNKLFSVPLRVFGHAIGIVDKKKKKRGPDASNEDFVEQKKYVLENKSLMHQSMKLQKNNKIVYASVDSNQLLNSVTQMENVDQYLLMKANQKKYDDFLKQQRLERYKKQKNEELNKKMAYLNQKLKETGQPPLTIPGDKNSGSNQNQSKIQGDDSFRKDPAPIDYEYVYSIGYNGLDSPRGQLPAPKDQLWVTRPIDKYEPYPQFQAEDKEIVFDAQQVNVKRFPSKPSKHAILRDCQLELNGEQLQKIFVGPRIIDFQHVFVKSRQEKYFNVRNELRTSIMVQLQIENEELSDSYIKPQIIPPSQTASFDIVFRSLQLQSQFIGYIGYIINGKHSFKFQVKANVDHVTLELNRTVLKFSFAENNHEMVAKENLRIENKGNSPGRFFWQLTDQKIFRVEPVTGLVPKNSYLDVKVIYQPTGNNFKGEEEKLVMKIEDGVDQTIKCIGYVNEAKCMFKEQSLDLGEVPISTKHERTINLKNVSRNQSIFQVQQDTLPLYTEVTPSKGRIPPDGTQLLKVSFFCKEEKKIEKDITVEIRGGKPISLPFTVVTVIPRVHIVEEEFNFGGVVFGNSETLPITIQNDSLIQATLILDLRSRDYNNKNSEGIQCLELLKQEEANDDESSILASIDKIEDLDKEEEEDDGLSDKLMEEKDNSDDEDEDEDEEEEHVSSRLYKIVVKPEQKISFKIKFTPADIIQYSFELPISLYGNDKIESLTRMVQCKGLKPRFLMEPKIIEFKKKIITGMDKSFPNYTDVIISNPDFKVLTWKIDTNVLEQDSIFSIKPSEGKIDAGLRVTLKAGFNPYVPDEYEKRVPLYLDGEFKKPYKEIIFKGLGAYPRLLFDRKEVILPIVPLGVVAKCSFRIINDGYENLTLKYLFPQNKNDIQIELSFPEGQSLGVTKSKIKVEVSFSSKKPFSFTTRLEFYDDSNRSYGIAISGTADNSLFTNYQYIQRNLREFKIICEENKPITLIDQEDDVDSQSSHRALSLVQSKAGSTTESRSAKSILGYSPIPQHLIDKNSEYIVKWLNYNVLSENIQNFPGDIIVNGGQQIYELLSFLLGKSAPQKPRIEPHLKKKEKVQLVYTGYQEVIKYLKENGALLNTIRPEYFLSLSEFNSFIKNSPNLVETSHVVPYALKINEHKYAYLSNEAWTVLFYQILRVYYLSRVNMKSFKNLPGCPPEKLIVPDYYVNGSNLLSSNEGILLRWMELHYELTHPLQVKRITNFDTDLRDCNVFASLIKSYVGANSVKALNQMKPMCQVEEDYKFNAEKLMAALNEIQIQTFLTVQDLLNPSAREIILFCLQLFLSLPNYISKATIEFSCVLGETVVNVIELSNPRERPISYWVRLEAHSDYSIEEDSIKLESKQQKYQYKITYVGRITKPVTGRIIFTNKKESNVQAATMVFDLVSKISGFIPKKREFVTSKLYEITQKDIIIENPFNSDVANFKIELYHKKYQAEESKKNNKKVGVTPSNKTGNTGNAQLIKLDGEQSWSGLIKPFYCRVPNIQIKKNGQSQISVQFMPFAMENHQCYIKLCDEKVGEIVYELIGITELPNTIELNPFQFVFSQQTLVELPLQFRNIKLETAKQIHKDRLTQQSKNEEKKDGINKKNQQNETQIQFQCELNSSFISVPQTFTVYENIHKINRNAPAVGTQPETAATGKRKKAGNDVSFESKHTEQSIIPLQQQSGEQQTNNNNKLPITVGFKAPVKDYQTRLILKNSAKTDVRVYDLRFNVLPKPLKAQIEMRVPARGVLVQDIPIVNNSQQDWKIIARFQQSNKNEEYFSGPSEINVKKSHTSQYPLTFRPPWICEVESKLTLLNQATKDEFEYDLKGFGEDLLAEGHIIVECKAKKTKLHQIEISNKKNDKPIMYKVETDLMIASGPQEFKIKPYETAQYPLSVTPLLGGTYIGSITFYDDKKQYIWYTIEVKTEAPKAESVVELTTQVRKVLAFDISIQNPLKENVTFEVITNGNGLFGDSLFTVGGLQTQTYELIFSPLKVFKERGSISFVNEKLGELWYELHLTSEDIPPQRLSTMKAELGKIEKLDITLENPSHKETKVTYKIKNSQNFDVFPEKIIILPYSQTTVQIHYKPSDIDVTETGEITFESEDIGNWHYFVFGIGLPPTKFETTVIAGALFKDVSSTINFKNPFKEQINVIITLESSSKSKGVFNLLLKKNKLTINGFNVLQIPFSFKPREISEYSAELVVTLNDKIAWIYPLKGITESESTGIDFHFKTKSRIKLDDDMHITLPGVGKIEQGELFSIELANIPQEYVNNINKWLVLSHVKNTLQYPEDHLVYNVKFTPMKPFKAIIDVLVFKANGGRWKFKLSLESFEPDFDDTIVIDSPINQTSSISFKLTNRQKTFTEFTAGFTADSDSEFTINPLQGMLEPYGKDGTNFVLSFTPVEYGKTRIAKLIIETEDMYWSYLVNGILPVYMIPDTIKSKVENKLPKNIEEQQLLSKSIKKNYMQENIKRSSSPIRLSKTKTTRSKSPKQSLDMKNSGLIKSIKERNSSLYKQ